VVRVLIVEDERKLAQVLSSALQAEHYDVVVAATGEDGFYRANAELFDLVVLDLMLPGRSGFLVLEKIKGWRQEYGFPARLSMNWGVQHPLQRLRHDESDYTYHEWSVPPGPFLEQFRNFGESTYRYPMHGVKRPVLEELVALSTFAREIVELSPGDAMPPVEIRPQTIWLESAVTAG